MSSSRSWRERGRAAAVALAATLAAVVSAAAPQARPDFRREVAPLLVGRCVPCHDSRTRAGGLDLTVPPGGSIPGRIVQKVAARQMPPGAPLADAEIRRLQDWVQAGAPWEPGVVRGEAVRPKAGRAGLDWWSLRPVRRPPAPRVREAAWRRNPVDAFVRAELGKRGGRPAPPADRATLLRRVAFDLTGLPPTPEELQAFLNDRAPGAYERQVDRLLASPHYGERWARHWLDIARFGESHGFERDQIRDHAWRYRDYVIDAFNADKPYDRFVREQIAGDVLEPVTPEGIIATGFLVGAPWDEVGQSQVSAVMRARVREEELEETLGTVGQTFLGLTVHCARCHDHKFDPITRIDYYRFQAALAGVRHGNRPALTASQQRVREAQIADLSRKIQEASVSIAALDEAARARVRRDAAAPAVRPGPTPWARWNFEGDEGPPAVHLAGGAQVVGGRLLLDGKGAFASTDPLPVSLTEKTLEAWVALPDRAQRGGGVLSVETPEGGTFDALVFAEREPGKWAAGSDFFRRTRDLAAPPEDAPSEALIHLAVVYSADHRLQLYRNGRPYGDAYLPQGEQASLRTFPAGGARVLLGLRHTGAGNGFLAGAIEEARLYDRALSADEVLASFAAGVDTVPFPALEAARTPDERSRRDALLAQRDRWRAARDRLADLPLVYAANPREPAPTFVLARGDVESPGERVAPGGIAALPGAAFGLPVDAPEAERRRRLAAWLTDPRNPLTARVLVNRVWQHHFGRGLVGTPSDFGFNGERPTHPALLDWLAADFVRSGWSIKALHRRIVLSQTYRQSGRLDPRAARADAENRLLWRFAPRRLEGEAIRDAMLQVSGQLNPERGGPGFRPFTVTVNNSHFYTLTDPAEPAFNRRTIYRIQVQSARSPLLESLDCPDPSTKTPRRSVTVTPLQALELMNNSFVQRQAQEFAKRVSREAGPSPAAQVSRAFLLAFGRPPAGRERGDALALVRADSLAGLCWALLNASEFVTLR